MTQARKRVAPSPDERAVTRRLVVRKVHVLVIPDDANGEQVEAARSALVSKKAQKVDGGPAWMECGVFEGSKVGAIEAFAGKPNTPDAKPGEYRAPTVRAWQGCAVYDRPPEPAVTRKVIQ